MGPVGLQAALFNNITCYVVAPGIVAKIMEHIQATAEYPGEGNLYLAEIELSSFLRGRTQPRSRTAAGSAEFCKSHATVCH